MIAKLVRKKLVRCKKNTVSKAAAEQNNSKTQMKYRSQNSSMMELLISNTLLFPNVKEPFLEIFVRAVMN